MTVHDAPMNRGGSGPMVVIWSILTCTGSEEWHITHHRPVYIFSLLRLGTKWVPWGQRELDTETCTTNVAARSMGLHFKLTETHIPCMELGRYLTGSPFFIKLNHYISWVCIRLPQQVVLLCEEADWHKGLFALVVILLHLHLTSTRGEMPSSLVMLDQLLLVGHLGHGRTSLSAFSKLISIIWCSFTWNTYTLINSLYEGVAPAFHPSNLAHMLLSSPWVCQKHRGTTVGTAVQLLNECSSGDS